MPRVGAATNTDERIKQPRRRVAGRAAGACGLVALLLVAASIALAATPNDPQPGQRIDLKVLLLSADGTEPEFGAWKAALDREGVPYDTLVAYNGTTRAATLTDAQLADYGANHAKYQAVILASGDLGRQVINPDGTFELPLGAHRRRVGGARQVRADVRHPPAERLHGAVAAAWASTPASGIKQDGSIGHAHRRRQGGLPVPEGPDPVADDDRRRRRRVRLRRRRRSNTGRTGRRSSPPRRRRRRASAYLGIYTHPDDGREEMVMTVAATSTRATTRRSGTGCSTGSRAASSSATSAPTSGSTSTTCSSATTAGIRWPTRRGYDFESAIRMSPDDVDDAVAWQAKHRPPADHGLQHGRRRPVRRQRRGSAARARQAAQERVPLGQPHAGAPEPGLHDRAVHAGPDRRQPDAVQPAARPTLAAGLNDPSELSPASTRAWPTRARATPARSTRRRSTSRSRRRRARSRRARTTTRSRPTARPRASHRLGDAR